MALISIDDFINERDESDLINKLWIDFDGFNTIYTYAVECYKIVYSDGSNHEADGDYEEEEIINYFKGPTGRTLLSRRDYMDEMKTAFHRYNPFYFLIYNSMHLDEMAMAGAVKYLSSQPFYKIAKTKKKLSLHFKRAYSSFMGVEHPKERWWTNVRDEKNNGYVEVMFYGAMAVLIVRLLENEISKIRKVESDSISSIEEIIKSIEGLDGLLKRKMHNDEVGYLANEISQDIKKWRISLDFAHEEACIKSFDPRDFAFVSKSENDPERIFMADVFFGLRKEILIHNTGESGSFDAYSALPEYQLGYPEYMHCLGNAVEVGRHISGICGRKKSRPDHVIKNVIESISKKLSESNFYDCISSGERTLSEALVSRVSLIQRGVSYNAVLQDQLIEVYDIDFIKSFVMVSD